MSLLILPVRRAITVENNRIRRTVVTYLDVLRKAIVIVFLVLVCCAIWSLRVTAKTRPFNNDKGYARRS